MQQENIAKSKQKQRDLSPTANCKRICAQKNNKKEQNEWEEQDPARHNKDDFRIFFRSVKACYPSIADAAPRICEQVEIEAQ